MNKPIKRTLSPLNSSEEDQSELNSLRLRVQELERELAASPSKDPAFVHPKQILPSLCTVKEYNLSPKTVIINPNIDLTRVATAPSVHNRTLTDTHPVLPRSESVDWISEAPADAPGEPGVQYVSRQRDEAFKTKISIDSDGSMGASNASREKMYTIVRELNTRGLLSEEKIVVLKKMIDAEIVDVLQGLTDIEQMQDPEQIGEELVRMFQAGSPSKMLRRSPTRVIPAKVKYPLQKIAFMLDQLGYQKSGTEVAVLVSSGGYNPVHMLHIRAFYLARQHVEANTKYPVVGGIISPCHDTYVRAKNRRTPRQMIPKKHRLAILEAATASSSWLEVDKWEITRRRTLDYLSTITHVREMCETQFPRFNFKFYYVCGCNTVVKLNHNELRKENFGCLVVCRPAQTDMVVRQLGAKWSKIAYIIEDTGVLSCELEAATSMRVRKIAMTGGSVKGMVGMHVSRYFEQNEIADKLAGRVPWNDVDRSWRPQDLEYVEYQDQSRTCATPWISTPEYKTGDTFNQGGL